MAISQMEIIQSLGEAMAWLEREMKWGVPIAELRHLIGRIGELYVAVITNGQLAQHVNEKGYDVISKDGEHISVKTTTMDYSSGHISFNPSTLQKVDRVMILRVKEEEREVEILFDGSKESAMNLMNDEGGNGKKIISLSKLTSNRKPVDTSKIAKIKEAVFKEYKLFELESGTIEIIENGNPIAPGGGRPILRKIADKLCIPTTNSNGNDYNTRQLGSIIIERLSSGTKQES